MDKNYRLFVLWFCWHCPASQLNSVKWEDKCARQTEINVDKMEMAIRNISNACVQLLVTSYDIHGGWSDTAIGVPSSYHTSDLYDTLIYTGN